MITLQMIIIKILTRRKKVSPATAMAEASLLSQKAAILEQDNFKAMLNLQREEAALSKEEHHATTHLLQKMIEQLSPEEDPTDQFVARKQS